MVFGQDELAYSLFKVDLLRYPQTLLSVTLLKLVGFFLLRVDLFDDVQLVVALLGHRPLSSLSYLVGLSVSSVQLIFLWRWVDFGGFEATLAGAFD